MISIYTKGFVVGTCDSRGGVDVLAKLAFGFVAWMCSECCVFFGQFTFSGDVSEVLASSV